MNENCETCKIINSDSSDVVIIKTKFWRVALQSNQAYLGQSFVTLLTHKADLTELSHDEWTDFEILLKNLERVIKASFGAVHFNWSSLMNEAYRTDDSAPHVHWHVFPRYSQKVRFSGIDFEDLEFGHHYINRQFRVDQATLQTIGSEIKAKL